MEGIMNHARLDQNLCPLQFAPTIAAVVWCREDHERCGLRAARQENERPVSADTTHLLRCHKQLIFGRNDGDQKTARLVVGTRTKGLVDVPSKKCVLPSCKTR